MDGNHMTNPTDPRIEAAARKIQEIFREIDGHSFSWFIPIAVCALKAADEAAWLPIESAPKNQKLKLAWRGKDGEWRFEFGMASWDWRLGDYRSGVSLHHAATHWQPLPTPPKIQ